MYVTLFVLLLTQEPQKNLVKFNEFEPNISTGDLAILERPNENVKHFAIFIQHDKCDPDFPLLLVKGKTKPMPHFDPKMPRHAHAVSAATRIFYGDYESVSIRNLTTPKTFECKETLKIIDEIPKIEFTKEEIDSIEEAKTPEERSAIVCTFMVAHFYRQMGILEVDPKTITPGNLENNLSLTDPVYIKLPPVKEGPLAHGDPPFLSKLV